MRILIVSDTHGDETGLREAIAGTFPIDAAIHLGDSEKDPDFMQSLFPCPLYLVSGNCDRVRHLPLTLVKEFDGVRMLIAHGHSYFAGVTLDRLKKAAKENGCSVAMYGHTHIPVIDESDPALTVLNPGSLSYPRQPGNKKSYILMETAPGRKPVFTLNYL